MNKCRLNDRLFVSEIYKNNIGWLKVEKKYTIEKIYRLFDEKEIESISIIKNGELFQSDYSYLSFRDEFCTIQKYFEKIVDEVRFDINLYIGINVDLTKIPFLLESTESWNGIYREYYFDKNKRYINKKNIAIRMSLVRESFNNPVNKHLYKKVKNVLYHEIGHYLHDIYFDCREISLSTKGKSSYAKKNHLEDFAEAFMDFSLNQIDSRNFTERDLQIFNLINSHVS